MNQFKLEWAQNVSGQPRLPIFEHATKVIDQLRQDLNAIQMANSLSQVLPLDSDFEPFRSRKSDQIIHERNNGMQENTK